MPVAGNHNILHQPDLHRRADDKNIRREHDHVRIPLLRKRDSRWRHPHRPSRRQAYVSPRVSHGQFPHPEEPCHNFGRGIGTRSCGAVDILRAHAEHGNNPPGNDHPLDRSRLGGGAGEKHLRLRDPSRGGRPILSSCRRHHIPMGRGRRRGLAVRDSVRMGAHRRVDCVCNRRKSAWSHPYETMEFPQMDGEKPCLNPQVPQNGAVRSPIRLCSRRGKPPKPEAAS